MTLEPVTLPRGTNAMTQGLGDDGLMSWALVQAFEERRLSMDCLPNMSPVARKRTVVEVLRLAADLLEQSQSR